MAGVKITDLATITSAASNDLLYIVDVSNTTQSPEGTSSQIEVGNMFSSGSYTPTISGETNLTATPNAATYIKVGNIVNVSIQLEISFAAAENSGVFELSLPVASNFTTVKQCLGLLQYSYNGTESELVALTIGANTTNNTCQVDIEVVTDELSMQYVVLQFQYEIFS
jgi:hypothetical protein